ncbi:MAG: hypothetical protein GF344_14760 [Chitinivibrionales bacterium]|nr:hypothetical protein [Chitinivibrionales bacterium]MBD3357973.1 hypothetical protein [Chitinivibrionales bacterium]
MLVQRAVTFLERFSNIYNNKFITNLEMAPSPGYPPYIMNNQFFFPPQEILLNSPTNIYFDRQGSLLPAVIEGWIMNKNKTQRLRDCRECGARCCRHVALEIDKPTGKRDYDNIRWYLLHEGVSVFTDHEGAWHVEFATRCERLCDDLKCGKYADRPKLCRDYPRESEYCEFESDQSPYDLFFSRVEEFERYLDRKKIQWRWKRLKD